MTRSQILRSNNNDVKSLSDKINSVPWVFIEILASLPAMLFIIGEGIQLFNLIFRYEPYHDEGFYDITDTVNSFSLRIGIITYMLYILKLFAENKHPKLRISPTFAFFAVLVLFMLISTVVNGYTEYARYGEPYRYESLTTFIMYPMIFFLCSTLITNKRIKNVVCFSFLFLSFVIGIISLINYYMLIYGYEPILYSASDEKMLGLFSNSNHYGYYLTICIMLSSSLFVLEKNKAVKIFCLTNFILNTYVLIINNTFGCYLACAFGLIFNLAVLFIINRKINILAAAAFLIYIVLTIISSFFFDTVMTNFIVLFSDIFKLGSNAEDKGGAGTGRWKLWVFTVKRIIEKPVFGWGTDGIADMMYDKYAITRTHNEFLQYTVFFGIPGGISYIAAAVSVFIRAQKNKKKLGNLEIASLTAAFAYLASSFFGNTMYYTAPLFFIFLGLGYGRSHDSQ